MVEKELKDVVHLHHMKNGKVLLIPVSLITEELAEMNYCIQEELSQYKKVHAVSDKELVNMAKVL